MSARRRGESSRYTGGSAAARIVYGWLCGSPTRAVVQQLWRWSGCDDGDGITGACSVHCSFSDFYFVFHDYHYIRQAAMSYCIERFPIELYYKIKIRIKFSVVMNP